MARKVAVNGLGRIGRLVLRELLEDDSFEVVAANDIASMDTLAYLLKHSSERGPFGEGEDIYGEGGALCVGDSRIPAFQEADARRLPWRELGAELVLECSGAYTSSEKAQAHLDAGAKRVLISAAAGTDIPTIVCGINDSELDPGAAMVSGASCSTVGLSPLAAALDECAPILHGISTTIHALTPSQMVLDDAQRNGNLRRSRTASTNIIPTSAAAAKAVGLVIPHLNGKLSGFAIRVPVTKGSYITLYACVTADELDVASLMRRSRAGRTGGRSSDIPKRSSSRRTSRTRVWSRSSMERRLRCPRRARARTWWRSPPGSTTKRPTWPTSSGSPR